MARIEIDPNFSSPTFSRATASTDLFKKEDVQALAAAVSTHVHDGAGKGLSVVPGAATIPGTALTNGSVTLAKLAPDSVDSSKIIDGTIATADLANASVTNAKLASDTARANLLTNGGFEVWQRGNGPFTANGAIFADRWTAQILGTDTLSVSKNTAGTESPGAAACTFTLGTGGGVTALYQQIKRADGDNLAGRTVAVSLRANVTTANAVRLGVTTDGSGGTTTYSAYHAGTSAWATLSVSVAVPTNATYITVAVNFAASCTAYVDNAMLVVGSVAADYAPLHPADDLARCLRYYQRWGPGISGGRIASGQAFSTNQAVLVLPLKAQMGGTPTQTLSAHSDWGSTNAAATLIAATSIGAAVGMNGQAIDLLVNPLSAASLVAGNATVLGAMNANSYYALEYNP